MNQSWTPRNLLNFLALAFALITFFLGTIAYSGLVENRIPKLTRSSSEFTGPKATTAGVKAVIGCTCTMVITVGLVFAGRKFDE
jgi:uncharacterized membrane protein